MIAEKLSADTTKHISQDSQVLQEVPVALAGLDLLV